jgi:hypothetical protein
MHNINRGGVCVHHTPHISIDKPYPLFITFNSMFHYGSKVESEFWCVHRLALWAIFTSWDLVHHRWEDVHACPSFLSPHPLFIYLYPPSYPYRPSINIRSSSYHRTSHYWCSSSCQLLSLMTLHLDLSLINIFLRTRTRIHMVLLLMYHMVLLHVLPPPHMVILIYMVFVLLVVLLQVR